MLNPEIQNFLSNVWEQFLIYLKNLWSACARFFTFSPIITPTQDISDNLSDGNDFAQGSENFHLNEVDDREEMGSTSQEVILIQKPHQFDTFISIFKGVEPEIYLGILFSIIFLIFNQTPEQSETYNPQMTL